MVSRYFYLELEIYLSAGGRAEVSAQAALQRAVQALFGECGAGGVRADVLRVRDARVLLRVRAARLRKLRAALALCDPPLRVRAEAPSLQALFAMSATDSGAMSAPDSGARSWRLGDAGQHVLLVASKEQLSSPSAVSLPPPEPAPGLILPDGSINWGCPCLGGMATGPCGAQFRDAFSCFHYSEADPKGSDCYEKFSVMQECMAQYPQLYAKDDDDDELAAALDAEQGAGDPAADSGRAGDSSAAASADQ